MKNKHGKIYIKDFEIIKTTGRISYDKLSHINFSVEEKIDFSNAILFPFPNNVFFKTKCLEKIVHLK